MMNMFDQAERLRDFSREQLVDALQNPNSSAPQFLALSELKRRERAEQEMANPEAPTSTVAQDAVNAAGMPQAGLAGMMQAMAPQTDIAQNTAQNPAQNTVQKLAEGGLAGISTNPRSSFEEFLKSLAARQTLLERNPNVRLSSGNEPQYTAPQAQPALGPYALTEMIDGPMVGAPMPTDMGVSRSLRDYGLSSDPAIMLMADRAGVTVPQYLQSLQPEALAQHRNRINRNRMVEFEPLGDGIAFPTQRDLDVNARDAAVGIGSVPAQLRAPSVDTLPDMPTDDAYMPSALPDMPVPPARPQDSRVGGDTLPEAAPSASLDGMSAEQSAYYETLSPEQQRNVRMYGTPIQPTDAAPMNTSSAFQGINDYAFPPLTYTGNFMSVGDAIDRYTAFEQGTEYTGPIPTRADETGMTMAPDQPLDPNNLLPPVVETPPAAPDAPQTPRAPTGSVSALTSGLPNDMVTDADKRLESDYWLALAKFGAALAASSGGGTTFGQDVGTAGAVGLAAVDQARADYEQRKKDALELAMTKAKFEMDMRVANARLASAGGSGGGSGEASMDPVSASWYNALIEKRSGILAAIEGLTPPEKGGLFKSASDPDALERVRLNKELRLVNVQLQIAERSNGFPILGIQGVDPDVIDTTQ